MFVFRDQNVVKWEERFERCLDAYDWNICIYMLIHEKYFTKMIAKMLNAEFRVSSEIMAGVFKELEIKLFWMINTDLSSFWQKLKRFQYFVNTDSKSCSTLDCFRAALRMFQSLTVAISRQVKSFSRTKTLLPLFNAVFAVVRAPVSVSNHCFSM